MYIYIYNLHNFRPPIGEFLSHFAELQNRQKPSIILVDKPICHVSINITQRTCI